MFWKGPNLFSSVMSKNDVSVYDEAMEMLAAALIIYIFADLRDLARATEASVKIEDLEPPMATDKMLENIKINKEALMASCEYNDLEERLVTLEHLRVNMIGPVGNMFAQNMSSQLVKFVDTNAHNEMVHAITVNNLRKRVSVIFRGSVTASDFITDANVVQTKVQNPVFQLDENTPETINIHSGFRDYLFKVNSTTGKSRLQSILDDVKDLLSQNPGYRLYCTGHSLGGALSTLCGFYAAADDDISRLSNGPVRVISIASPYVGNVKFLLAFQALERNKRLQHLRIANAEDVVTLLPLVAPKLGALSPLYASKHGAGNLYKHCGMKLRLTSDPQGGDKYPYRITFPQDQSSDENYAKEISNLIEDGKNFFKSLKLAINKEVKEVAKYHSFEVYEPRLQACKSELSNVSIDNLYENKEIVGDVLNPGYVPKVMLTVSERLSRIMNSETLQEQISKSLK